MADSGVEAAIDLAGICSEVTLLEFGDALRADAILQRKLESLPNATIVTSARTTEVVGDGTKVSALRWEDRRTGQILTKDLDGIFVQIGTVAQLGVREGTRGDQSRRRDRRRRARQDPRAPASTPPAT